MNTFFTAPYNASTRTHYLKALNAHYLSWDKLQIAAPVPVNGMKMKTTKLPLSSRPASNNSNQDG